MYMFRKRFLFRALILIALLTLAFEYFRRNGDLEVKLRDLGKYARMKMRAKGGSGVSDATFDGRSTFFEALYDNLARFKPMDPPNKRQMKAVSENDECPINSDISLNDKDMFSALTYEALNKCYRLDPQVAANLKSNHAGFVEWIKTLELRKLVDTMYTEEEGIVTVGGGRYSVLLLTMLEQLRYSQTKLPVEIFIPPQDEGDFQFCETFVPRFNARCIYLKDVLPEDVLKRVKVERFQIKSLAILSSSFKKVMFLDADNYVVKRVDNVFSKPAFKDTGLILWPDVWLRFTPPAYYDIASIPVDLQQRSRYLIDDVSPVSRYTPPDTATTHDYKTEIAFHDLMGTMPNPSTESGQMLVDKSKHMDTLLLAMYYNTYGPMWYYRMLSLGTSGEGDKETFIAAATALNKPYYQVKTPIQFDGFHHDTRSYQGVGLMQHDFNEDYELYTAAKHKVAAARSSYFRYDPNYTVLDTFLEEFMKNGKEGAPSVMFEHISFYKLDPVTMIKERLFLAGDGRTQVRGLSHPELINYFDLELFLFETLLMRLCSEDVEERFDDIGYLWEHFNSEDKWEYMCIYIRDHLSFLVDTHEQFIEAHR